MVTSYLAKQGLGFWGLLFRALRLQGLGFSVRGGISVGVHIVAHRKTVFPLWAIVLYMTNILSRGSSTKLDTAHVAEGRV